MMKLVDPNALVEIDIEGVKFYVKQMTNADKLRMHDKLKSLTVGAGEFFDMMNMCADLVVDIKVDGYVFTKLNVDMQTGGTLKATEQVGDGNDPTWKPELRPADGLTARELVQRIEDVRLQKALYSGICDASSLEMEAEKN